MADDPTVATLQTLEGLLQQFNDGTASPPVPAQPPQPALSPREQDSIQRHQRDAQVAEEQHRRNVEARNPSPEPNQALQAAVRMFRSGDLADADEVAAEGYILARSLRDPAFNEAMSSGDARRAAKAIEIARKDYQAATGHGYLEGTDRERARASVRGGSSDSPSEFDPVRASKMSDAEYAADVARRTGIDVRPANVWTGDLRSRAAGPWSLHDGARGGGPPAPGGSGSRPKPMIGGRRG